jgi:hypothetical protein
MYGLIKLFREQTNFFDDFLGRKTFGYKMRKANVITHGAIVIHRNRNVIKISGRGKKVGIPPTRIHELAEVRPYL